MFCVVKRSESEFSVIFETYAEMRDYVKRVYKRTRLKDRGSYILQNEGTKHLEAQRADLLRSYKDEFKCVCFDEKSRKELERMFPNGTKKASVWRLEVFKGVVRW